jgi:hypothetical protein
MQYLGSSSADLDMVTKEYVDRKAGQIPYGECETAAATQAKTVTVSNVTELAEGMSIRVRFVNAQTYNGVPTLNVNGLGAKNIRRTSAANAARYEWVANEILDLVYDGTYWVIVDGGLATTSYYGVTKLYTGAASTSTALALTPQSLNLFSSNVLFPYPTYSTSETYDVGDRVRYSSGVYECITAITTGEAWTAAHWDMIDPLQTQLDNKIKAVTVTLTVAGWSNSTQTVTVTGILADETKQLIQPVPASASRAAYEAAGVEATAQAANSLTFACTETPPAALTVYVVITEVVP